MMGVMHGPGGGSAGYTSYEASMDSGMGMGMGPPPLLPPSAFPAPQGSNTFELIPHRVFVGGFPPGTTDVELREFFEQFGLVREVKLIMTPEGVPRGYGFITYSSEQEASHMRSVPHERLEFKGRRLNIGPAMRRITLGTRPNDLAVASPSFGPLAHPPAPTAPGGIPGYHTALPFNYFPAYAHAPNAQQTPYPAAASYQLPTWPHVSIQAASPPGHAYYPVHGGQASPDAAHSGGRYQGGHRPNFHQRNGGNFRGKSRFEDRARKAGGGGATPLPNHAPLNTTASLATTPADRGDTPLPPLGHPLTPLTPGYTHDHNQSSQTGQTNIVNGNANFLRMPLSPGPI